MPPTETYCEVGMDGVAKVSSLLWDETAKYSASTQHLSLIWIRRKSIWQRLTIMERNSSWSVARTIRKLALLHQEELKKDYVNIL